jgi:hypothetical protein
MRAAARWWAVVLALTTPLPGCVTLSRTEQGTMPGAAAIAGLAPGARLDDVLAACGPPVEAWRQPEGLALVYRARHYAYDRYGFDPSRLLELLPISSVPATVLANLRLTVESGSVGEDRIVVVFDRDDRLTGVAYRSREVRREP